MAATRATESKPRNQTHKGINLIRGTNKIKRTLVYFQTTLVMIFLVPSNKREELSR